jgi:hypothetical protein
VLLRQIKRALQLWPSVKRVGPLSSLYLDLFAQKRKAVRLCEPRNGPALRLQPETGLALPVGRDPVPA